MPHLAPPVRLTDEEIAIALLELPGWKHANGLLIRDHRFGSFPDAMAFILRAAFEAEAAEHHPNWSHVYSHVTIMLTTHDAGHQVTQRDIDFARRLQPLLPALP